MAQTALQVVTTAYQEMGLTAPPAVVGSSDPQVLQFLALLNKAGRFLQARYDFRRGIFQYVFQTTASATVTGDTTLNSPVVQNVSSTASLAAGMVVSGTGIPDFSTIVSVDSASQFTMDMAADAAGTTSTITYAVQDYAFPSDFDREISKTNFDRTDHWANLGPKSPQEWQWLQSGNISTAPRYRYRRYGNKLRFFPAPTSVINMVYEYVSQYWVIPTGGSNPTKAAISLDTDLFIYPDDLMIAGLKAFWKLENGLMWEVAGKEFIDLADARYATDEDNPTLNLAPRMPSQLLNISAVPEGSWNL